MSFKDVFKQAYTGQPAVKVDGTAPNAGAQVKVANSQPQGTIVGVSNAPVSGENFGGAPAVPSLAYTSKPAIDFQSSFKDVFTKGFNEPLPVTGAAPAPDESKSIFKRAVESVLNFGMSRLHKIGDPLIEAAQGNTEPLKKALFTMPEYHRDLSDDEKKNLKDVLYGKAEPINDRVSNNANFLKQSENAAFVLSLDAGHKVPTKTTIYRGQAKGQLPNENGYQFYTDSPKQAREYAKINTPLKGESEIVTQDIAGKRFKEVAKSEYLKAVDDANVRAEYDGIKFKDGDGTSYALFKKEPVPSPAGMRVQADSPRTATSPAKVSEDVSYNPTIAKDNIFYNVDRLNIPKEAKQAVKNEVINAKPQVEKIVGKKLSNQEVVAVADNSSKILNRTITREQTADRIAANLNLRRTIANAAKDGKIDGEFIELWMKDKSQATDIARQLQARRVNADPRETSLIDTLLDGIYKEVGYSDELAAAAKGVDFNDSKQATEFYRRFVKPKAREWIDLLRYNSMLSSPQTHINNAVSNFQGTGILAPIEKTITGVLDATRAALTGSERQYFVGEGVEFAKGYYSNLKQATQNFADVMRSKTLSQNPDTRNIPLATGGAKAVTEKVLAFPMKLLEASDQFFTALTEGGAKKALAYKASKGAKVGNIESAASEEAAKRLFRSETGLKEQGYVLDAIDKVTNTIQTLRNSDNAIVSTIAKFTLPFVRTPMNILKQGIEYSPAGVITLPGASNKTEQLAKLIMGIGTASGVATLLGSDRLTWAEPTNPDQKAAFRAAGRQPYAVKVGDNWVSYSKLHPAIAFNFALVAAIDDAQKNKKLSESQGESVLSAFAKWGNFVADQSYLKSIGDFVAATKGDASGWSKYVSNYPQQLIPFRALMSWVTRLTDPVQRQADPDGSVLEKQMQQLMSQIPGLSEKVPARTDLQGNPIENQNRMLNSVSPNRVTTEKPAEEDSYKTALEAKKLNRDQTERKNQLTAEARKKYESMKQSPQDFKADLKAVAKVNPELAAKVLDLYEADQKNLSYTDRTIQSLDVKDGSRAQFIYAKIKSMDKGQKKAYLLDLAEKKVLTDEVLDQILKLSESN